MQPILLTGFAGSATDTRPRLLDEHVGVNVVDAEPRSGDLRPLHASAQVATVPSSPQRKTLFRMRQGAANEGLYWLSWQTRVHIVRALDGDAATERIYYTGDGTPKWTDNTIALGSAPYPQASRELSVPPPDSQLILAETTPGTGDDGDRFYVQTFVNDRGWESAPSPVSAALTCKPGVIVAITGLNAPPSGNYGITLRRIYRTQPGTAAGAATFFFLRELAVGVGATTDDARALGDPIATIGFLALDPGAKNLLYLWNGMIAMTVGKTLSFTPPETPYTAPVKWDINLNENPVALRKWDQNLLVLTEGAPAIYNGQSPDAMVETPFRVGYSCSSEPGAVGFEHGVVWPSAEGLAYTGSDTLITLGVINTRDWKLLNPASMVAGRWRSLYVCSYLDAVSGTRKGFMFDPLRPGLGIWFLSFGWDACYYDEKADELYILAGGSVRKFDAGITLYATFRSKVFHQLAPRNFGYGKVVADSYPVQYRVFADGALVADLSVANEDAFPVCDANFKASDWQIEVSGNDSIEAAHLVADMRDLKGP